MFTKILLMIKGANLTAKITTAIVAVAVVGGGTTALVVVTHNSNDPKNADEQSETSISNNNETQNSTESAETPNPNDNKEPTEKTESNNSEKPGPETPENPTGSETSTEPDGPNAPNPATPEPTPTCSDLKNCDFNLNDQYIIETSTYNFYSLPEGVEICDYKEPGVLYLDVTPIVETKTFYQIGDFTGTGGGNVPHVTPTKTSSAYAQAKSYAAARGLAQHHDGWGCGGMGDIMRNWTWQETVDKGFALDEAKCNYWGLSCGRW